MGFEGAKPLAGVWGQRPQQLACYFKISFLLIKKAGVQNCLLLEVE